MNFAKEIVFDAEQKNVFGCWVPVCLLSHYTLKQAKDYIKHLKKNNYWKKAELRVVKRTTITEVVFGVKKE